MERVGDTTSPLHELYRKKTGHLTESQCEFFRKWEALISLEEQDLHRFKKELWTMSAEEREAHGRCFSSMIMDQTYKPIKPETNDPGVIRSFSYRFTKKSFYLPVLQKSGLHAPDSLLNGHMSVGDPIAVSVEPDLLAIAKGYVTALTPEEVTIGVDHKIDPQDIAERTRSKPGGKALHDDVVEFRIDKDELSTGLAKMRYNLASLFYAEGDARLLELVVDHRPPVFNKRYDGHPDNLHTASALLEISKPLNSSQKLAVRRALDAEDYALVLGVPGSGKTTVIVALIKTLVQLGKTVLLTSYTHSAVDNILLKLKDDVGFGILRIGNPAKVRWPNVHDEIANSCASALDTPRGPRVYSLSEEHSYKRQGTRAPSHHSPGRRRNLPLHRPVSVRRDYIDFWGCSTRIPQCSVLQTQVRLLYCRRGFSNRPSHLPRPTEIRRQIYPCW